MDTIATVARKRFAQLRDMSRLGFLQAVMRSAGDAAGSLGSAEFDPALVHVQR